MNFIVMTTPSNISSKKNLSRGFSLVEVVMALGIVAFALTSMLGLFPVGLIIFRDSIESTVQTDVLRQLSVRFQETPFAEVTSSQKMIYFSEQSQRVSNSADGLLGVTWDVVENTEMPAGTGTYTNSHLKTVQVHFHTRADRAKSEENASITDVLYVASGIH